MVRVGWETLIGQLPARAYLQSVLTGDRLAHAFLFKGPVGVGKRTAAYVFAQTLMCHARAGSSPGDLVRAQACGTCQSCRWFMARKGAVVDHPDFISMVHPAKNDRGAEKLVGDQEPMIRLETVQHFCEKLYRSPMAGTRRVLIIPEAQRLCRGQAEAANAFLKTLEEPPRSAMIILTTSQPEGLLDTITSRVQTVQFKRLGLEDIRIGISRFTGRSGEEVEPAVLLADGSLGRALELLQGDLKNWRSKVMRSLNELLAQKELLTKTPAVNPVAWGIGLWGIAETEGHRLFEIEKNAGKEVSESDEDESDELAVAAGAGGEESGADLEAQVKTESGWKRYVFRRLIELCEVAFRDGLVVAATTQNQEKPLKEGQAKEGQEGQKGQVVEPPILLQPDQLKLAQGLAARFGVEGCQRMLAAFNEALFAVRLYVRGDIVGRALAGKMVDCQLLIPA